VDTATLVLEEDVEAKAKEVVRVVVEVVVGRIFTKTTVLVDMSNI